MEAAKKIFTRAHIIWFLLLNFGLVLLAAGIHFFKSPNNFAMGGTSGISIIAATLLPHMDVGTFMFIINGVLIVLGLVFLGRAVIGATLYSSVALSFYVWVLERAVPMARPFTDDTFLELCYAVILPAAGSAIIFNIGASSGGCCFSKRMRKLFRKNEKSVLQFCNKSSKTKRAFTKVLMPCKRPF